MSYYKSQSGQYQSQFSQQEEEHAFPDKNEEEEDNAGPDKAEEGFEEQAGTSGTRGRKLAKHALTAPSRASSMIDPLLIFAGAGGHKIPEIFLSFSTHIAFFVYQSIERPILTYQLRNEQLCKWYMIDESLDEEADWTYIIRFHDLHDLQGLMYPVVNISLLDAFFERWQLEINSFHMPWEEMTITLHDLYFILGLQIDGNDMSHIDEDKRIGGRKSIQQLLIERAMKLFKIPAKYIDCQVVAVNFFI